MQRSRGLALTLLAALAALSLLSACGDSGPSMDDWREDATPVCTTRDDALKAIAPPLYLVDMAGAATRVAETSEKARAALVALERPEDEEGQPSEVLTQAMAALNESLRPWADVLRGDDYTAMETRLNEVMAKAKAVDDAATAARVPACATTTGLLENPLQKAGQSSIRSSFAEKANGVCDTLFTKHQAVLENEDSSPAAIRRVAAAFDELLAELRKLKPPLTNREAFDGVLNNLGAFSEALKTAASDARKTSQAAVEARLTGLAAQFEAHARAYGLSDCGG